MTAPSYDPTNYGNRPGDGPLRIGGVSAERPRDERDLPSTPSPCARAQAPAVALIRDVLGGTQRIRAAGPTYLPQAPGEDPRNYAIRLNRSVFFNAFKQAVEGLVGFVFQKDPVLGNDVPVQIRGSDTDVGHWENIDLAGTHGDVFCRERLQDALATGHNAILVDYPNTGAARLSIADEQRLRPYWVPISKEQMLSWRTAVIDGRTVLTQLVVRECTSVADGAFGETDDVRYRVFYRDPSNGVVGYRLLKVDDRKMVSVVDEGTYPTQEEIPIAEIVTSGRKSLFESDPPLLDLAYLNIAHYQQWSDRATSIHKTCVPIYVETGIDPEPEGAAPVVLGPNSARRFSNPNAKAMYVTHDGAALGECTKAIEEIKSDMAVLGIAMLAPSKRAAETAKAKQIDKSASDSSLGVTARGLQDGIERALGFHAKYLRLGDGGSIKINRDFDALMMDPQVMLAYVQAAKDAGFPVDILLREWQAGGRIGPDVDIDTLAAQMEANLAAAAAQQQIERQAQLDAATAGASGGTAA